MKLVYFVETYGGRPFIRVDWQRMVFFAGTPPPVESFVVLEAAELRSTSADHVLAWIAESTSQNQNPNDVVELPESLWRRAEIDDFIDASNAQSVHWYLPRGMPLSEFVAFSERWSPELQARSRRVLEQTDPDKKLKQLAKLADFGTRVLAVESRMPDRARHEESRSRELAERRRVREIEARRASIEDWIALAEDLEHEIVANQFVCSLAQRMRAEAPTEQAFLELLERVRATSRLRARTARLPGFWAALAPRLRFSANVKGETIDLTNAVEQSVPASWELYAGRRVGTIAPGRTALVVSGKRPLYVRGQRKLLVAIARAGGTLRRFGCSLCLRSNVEDSLRAALLETERIDALAHLDPEALRPELDRLGLPPGDDAYRALDRVREDPRQARVLADLLVERRIGIDADVARAHARAQSSRNRR